MCGFVGLLSKYLKQEDRFYWNSLITGYLLVTTWFKMATKVIQPWQMGKKKCSVWFPACENLSCPVSLAFCVYLLVFPPFPSVFFPRVVSSCFTCPQSQSSQVFITGSRQCPCSASQPFVALSSMSPCFNVRHKFLLPCLPFVFLFSKTIYFIPEFLWSVCTMGSTKHQIMMQQS